MDFFRGMMMNVRGLGIGLRTPSLLFLGMIRFLVVIILAVILSGFALYWHQELLGLIWQRPETGFMVYVWALVSWVLSLLVASMSVMISYLIAQVFFCVIIMDYMSRITERIYSGQSCTNPDSTIFQTMMYLILQEIPRAIVPVVLVLLLMLVGFLTPLGPVIAIISTILAAMFLAWDNTDLLPARKMFSFTQRFGLLKSNLFFHLGFGIWFLIPWVNILFLSFAPVGGTLFHLEKMGGGE